MHTSPPDISQLALAAVAAVLAHARQGLLPSFSITLGLDYAAYRQLLLQHSAAAQTHAAIPEHEYATTLATCPAQFVDLVDLLLHQRSGDSIENERLARAIAAASFGSRHLWQDLGMSGRNDVSALLQEFFPAFYAGNVHNYKWKKFLFAELGQRQGAPNLRPPKCSGCDQFHTCFPEADASSPSTEDDLYKE